MAIFAKYDGIDGEATDANHHKWIDILSLDWGAHRPAAGATGASRRRGQAIVDDMVLTFDYEKAAPKLLDKCLRGGVVPKVEIELTANFGGTRVTYLKYELKNVMVASYRVSASGDDEAGPPAVVVANNFEELKVTYTEFDATGAAAGNVETVYQRDKGSRSNSSTGKTAAKKTAAKKTAAKKTAAKKTAAKKSGTKKRKKTK